MAVKTTSIPLPFDDACVVLAGRLADAGFSVELDQAGKDESGLRTRMWVLATGGLAAAIGPILVPTLPSQAYVKVTDRGQSSEVVVVASGTPFTVLLEVIPLGFGAGHRAFEAVDGGTTRWTAGPR